MPRTAWPAAPSPRPGDLDRCLAAQLAQRYADLRAFATWFPAQGVEVPACWQAHGGVVHRLAAVYAWKAPAYAPDAHRREAADLWALGLARLQRDRESLLAHRGKHPPPDARGDNPCRSLSSRSSSRPRWPPVPSGTPSPAPPDGPHPPLPIPPALRARSPLTPGPRRHLGRLGCDLHHRQRGPSGPHALHRHLVHRWPRRLVAGHALRPAPAATPAPLRACDRGSPGVADPAGRGWPGVALRPTSGGGSGPGTAPLRRDQGSSSQRLRLARAGAGHLHPLRRAGRHRRMAGPPGDSLGRRSPACRRLPAVLVPAARPPGLGHRPPPSGGTRGRRWPGARERLPLAPERPSWWRSPSTPPPAGSGTCPPCAPGCTPPLATARGAHQGPGRRGRDPKVGEPPANSPRPADRGAGAGGRRAPGPRSPAGFPNGAT